MTKEITPIELVSALIDEIEEARRVEMVLVLQEIYENAMDYGAPYYTLERWEQEFGKVEWNVDDLDGFYIADGFIAVR